MSYLALVKAAEGFDAGRAGTDFLTSAGPAPASGGGTVGDGQGLEDPALQAAEAQAILALLIEELDPRDRLIVRRRFYDGWTQGEIVQEIGAGQSQVSRHLARILRALRREVGDLTPSPTAA